ncbi:MAG: hypothetical protein PGN11_08605 [Quadrisphaera sp.]
MLDVHLQVVLEVLADAGQVDGAADAEGGEVGGVTDARELQQLGRAERPAAQDHLTGVDAALELAAAQVVHAHRAGALHADAGHRGQRVHGEVLAVHHRVQVGAGGAEALAVAHVPVEGREALLAVAVDVVGERVPGLLHGFEERAEQG